MARIWVGTSGFSYKEWKGSFYPPDLPDKQFLAYYASQFSTVEIDSTFYRMPTAKTLQGWRDGTPAEFRFVIKASQQITHRQRLAVPSDALNYLTSAVAELGGRLALVSYQLPPFFKCDLAKLHSFLEVLPRNIMSGFEFRHPSWFVPDVYELLRRYRAILCVHDSDEGCSPMELTTDAVYVRLRRSVYTPEGREAWKTRWRTWAESGVEVFAYVKHKDNPDAPRIALEFASGV
jgi:uncharacterized protein YecE (DUF72 family)